MPKGITPPSTTPKPIHLAGRSTLVCTFLDLLGLTRSKDPRAWESAAKLLDESADCARTVSAILDAESQPQETPKAEAKESPASEADDAVAALLPGPHRVLFIGSTVDASFIGRLVMEGRRREGGR
jgi:hypothetical protein